MEKESFQEQLDKGYEVTMDNSMPYPVWVGRVAVRYSRSRLTYAITVSSRNHPDSKMPVKKEVRYITTELPLLHAVNTALHMVQYKLRPYSKGTVLCQEARQQLTVTDAKRLSAYLKERYGDRYLYTNEEAQMELARLLRVWSQVK